LLAAAALFALWLVTEPWQKRVKVEELRKEGL
jgi:hypothetical protein